MKKLSMQLDPLSRRRFVSQAALSCLGVGSMPLLAGAAASGRVPMNPATAKRVIYLYMSGGMSHLDTFDTKPGHANQGPTESIKTKADGVQVSEHFPLLSKHMDKVAVINSLSSTQGAHARGQARPLGRAHMPGRARHHRRHALQHARKLHQARHGVKVGRPRMLLN